MIASAVMLTSLFMPCGASAEVVFNENVPIPFFTFVPCANEGAGEIVVFTGLHHVLIAETTDTNGGTHSMVHAQPSVGFIGSGLTTGDIYEGTGSRHGNENVSESGATEATLVLRANFVGIGKANDFQIYVLVHFTITPNGVTADVFESRIECR